MMSKIESRFLKPQHFQFDKARAEIETFAAVDARRPMRIVRKMLETQKPVRE